MVKKYIFSGSYHQSHALQASKQAKCKVNHAKQRHDELQGKYGYSQDFIRQGVNPIKPASLQSRAGGAHAGARNVACSCQGML